MPSQKLKGFTFDARPDRIDYRDREYQPALVSLPDHYPEADFIAKELPGYTKSLILNQGREGSCTGFGLAAVINYLLWRKNREARLRTEAVSAAMLYQLARIYDEWPGEDYEGSSCRGAMKGWHKHGACLAKHWPYKAGKKLKPAPDWSRDAALRPLGAYYRINKDSVADMQAAINEVGAIYCSAIVHSGWFVDKSDKGLPVIQQTGKTSGGHAFALVGYEPRGFIVQNSWGPNWGFHGFALLPYGDWIQNGSDAWVAVLGAPMTVIDTRRSYSSSSLEDHVSGKTQWFWNSNSSGEPKRYANPKVEPCSEDHAYEHSIVLGNDGRPLNRFADLPSAHEAVKEACFTLPLEWLRKQATPRIAIYAHGGLNEERASVTRVPIFITWKTGFGESVSGIIKDAVAQYMPGRSEVRAEGFMDWAKERLRQLKDAKNRVVELACEKVLVKAIWAQMKQNADASCGPDAGLSLLAAHLAQLTKQLPKLEVHLVGHSAGSIILGHFLDRLRRKKLKATTCSLYAPACTVEFALDKYVGALRKRVLRKQGLHFDILSDERERADSVGPYGKSLLYLVSRALETVHKKALLGMAAAWSEKEESEDVWHSGEKPFVRAWRKAASDFPLRIHTKSRAMISTGTKKIPIGHGSFDNDVDVVEKTLVRIRNGRALSTRVERLDDF